MPPRAKKPRSATATRSDTDISTPQPSAKLPRVTKKTSVAALVAEAVARGHSPHDLPERKNELLAFLVEGTIQLTATAAWREVENLREQIQTDAFQKSEASTGAIGKAGGVNNKQKGKKFAKYDIRQFEESIIKPSTQNKKVDGNEKKGYTVWCSCGYRPDGFHSYSGPPEVEFDTTYMSKDEANARARYLFFWKNTWGWKPEQIEENDEVKKVLINGLVKYEVWPDDSEVWTVAVVPDVAFEYLPEASKTRHTYDDDEVNSSVGQEGKESWNGFEVDDSLLGFQAW